jgi:hypothetical protein
VIPSNHKLTSNRRVRDLQTAVLSCDLYVYITAYTSRYKMPIPTPTKRPPTSDTDDTSLNPSWPENTPHLSFHTAHTLHLVHNHAHLTQRVYNLNTAYDLDFIILASLTIISGHAINEISLDDMSYLNTTIYSLLWYTVWDLIMAQCKGRNMLS